MNYKPLTALLILIGFSALLVLAEEAPKPLKPKISLDISFGKEKYQRSKMHTGIPEECNFNSHLYVKLSIGGRDDVRKESDWNYFIPKSWTDKAVTVTTARDNTGRNFLQTSPLSISSGNFHNHITHTVKLGELIPPRLESKTMELDLTLHALKAAGLKTVTIPLKDLKTQTLTYGEGKTELEYKDRALTYRADFYNIPEVIDKNGKIIAHRSYENGKRVNHYSINWVNNNLMWTFPEEFIEGHSIRFVIPEKVEPVGFRFNPPPLDSSFLVSDNPTSTDERIDRAKERDKLLVKYKEATPVEGVKPLLKSLGFNRQGKFSFVLDGTELKNNESLYRACNTFRLGFELQRLDHRFKDLNLKDRGFALKSITDDQGRDLFAAKQIHDSAYSTSINSRYEKEHVFPAAISIENIPMPEPNAKWISLEGTLFFTDNNSKQFRLEIKAEKIPLQIAPEFLEQAKKYEDAQLYANLYGNRIRRNDLLGVKQLIRQDIPLNFSTSPLHGMSPLYTALQNSCTNVNFLRLLLNSGASLNNDDLNGRPTFMYLPNNSAKLQVILPYINDEFQAQYRSSNNYSFLHYIVGIQNPLAEPIALKLLEMGADPNLPMGKEEITPLHLAYKSRPKIIEAIIKHGGDCNKVNKYGLTALHNVGRSSRGETAEKIRLLVEGGAEINKQDNLGNTPLIISCYNPRTAEGVAAAKELIRLGADIEKTDNFGCGPLIEAARYNKKEMCRLLLKSGADPYAMCQKNRTAVWYAIKANKPDVIRLFIEKGVDMKKPCEGISTPAEKVAQFGRDRIAEILRNAGIKIPDMPKDDKGEKVPPPKPKPQLF